MFFQKRALATDAAPISVSSDSIKVWPVACQFPYADTGSLLTLQNEMKMQLVQSHTDYLIISILHNIV